MTDRAEIERLLNQTGRTLEEIKRRLKGLAFDCTGMECGECQYPDVCKENGDGKTAGYALALIERLEAERDAALAYMKRARICTECAHWDCGIDEPCMHCDHENNCFEWRGIQPTKEGE